MLEVGNFTGKGNGKGENKRIGRGQEKGEEILSFFLPPHFPPSRRQIYNLGVGGR